MPVSATLLVLALAGVGAPTRNARPTSEAAPATSPAPAPSPSDAEVAERVRTYLSSIDTPIGAAQWRALGPAAVGPLADVLADPGLPPSRRARAVEGLSAIGGGRAHDLVLGAARSDAEPFTVRVSALRNAPRVATAAELRSQLGPVLERARDAHVRATAADVLARHGGQAACGAVRAQAAREGSGAPRGFAQALQRCRPTSP